jgi:hypothetical protein
MTRDNRCILSPAPRFTLVFLLLLAWAPGATATTFTVTSLADSGPGSLRQAVLNANASVGPDEINFAPGLTGTITLTSGEIRITDHLVVNGPGAGVLTVSGNNQSRVFFVANPASALEIDVIVSALTLTQGFSYDDGGAIFAENENLTILNSIVSDSTSEGSVEPPDPGCGGNVGFYGYSTLRIVNSILTGGRGGDVVAPGSQGGNLCVIYGRLLLERSTVSGGSAGVGGGIFLVHYEGSVQAENSTIFRSTISANEAQLVGGGIYAYLLATLTIDSSTISGNNATSELGFGGGLFVERGQVQTINSTISSNFASREGGGIYFGNELGSWAGSLLLRLTTMSNNTAGVEGGNILLTASSFELELDHSIVANGNPDDLARTGSLPATVTANYSLIEAPGDTLLVGTNNIFGADPLLGPLANNGGPTLTHMLLPGSPALDAGNPAIPSPPPTDQRGFARILGPAIDLGSVEGLLQPAGIPTLSQWGLLLLVVLFCVLGVRRLQKAAGGQTSP